MGTEISSYHFDGFRVDLVRHRLLGPTGELLPLSGRAFDALVFLVENRARVVTKDELLKAVWPHAVVEENNLNQAVSAIRRALGDTRESPRYVLTVPGRGYRFIGVETKDSVAPPVPAAAPEEAAESMPLPSSSPLRRRLLLGLGATAVAAVGFRLWRAREGTGTDLPRSLAVLPFKPLVAAGRNEALEFGMAETLINRLSNLPGIVVAPLSSVRRYTELDQDPLAAGRSLDVEAVIDGTVQIDQGRVRLSARLLDTDDGRSLWSGSFDEDLDNYFAVQDALATSLVDALDLAVSAGNRARLVRRSTESVKAWQLYLQGRYEWSTRSEEAASRAIAYYQAAEFIDPKFPLPAAGLADAWAFFGVLGLQPPPAVFPRARDAAERAIRLDPAAAEAQASLAHILVQYDRDWASGERLYSRALALNPRYGQALMWLSLLHAYRGRLPEALAVAREARSLEPMEAIFRANEGLILYLQRDYVAAERELTEHLKAAPGFPFTPHYLARVLMTLGRTREAIALLEGTRAPAPGSSSDLGRAYALAGRADEARAELARLIQRGSAGFGVGYDLAIIHAALGDKEAAFTALEQGLLDHSQLIGFTAIEPALDSLRDDPRLAAIVRRLGLG